MNNSDELAGIAEINKLHQEVQELATGALDRAIRIGELLSRAKSHVPHGQWLPWLTHNVAFSERTARNYMRVFENRETLKSANVADLAEAYQTLAGQPQRALGTNSAPMTKEEAEWMTTAIIGGLNKILELKIQQTDLHLDHRGVLDPPLETAATLELLARAPSEEELREHLSSQIWKGIELAENQLVGASAPQASR